MAKRSTIGINPLDVVIPNPLEATILDQHEGTKHSTHREGKKQESGNLSAHERSSATSALQTKDEPEKKSPTVLKGGGQKIKSTIHQEDMDPSGQPERDGLSPSDKVGERLSGLELENLCLKWALGLILAPLALLALLG